MEPEQETDRGQNSKIYYLNNLHKKGNYPQHNLANQLDSVYQQIKELQPILPVYCLRPHILQHATRFFLDNFLHHKHQTKVMYSVKSNPDEAVLKQMFASGIVNFDVASFVEIQLIHSLFGDKAKMFFMHPIKAKEVIKEAYFNYNIRHFSLDSFDELEKILLATNNAKDLGLHLRISIPNSHSAIDLSGKFGILPSESVSLLRKIRSVAETCGICFHVGSQCMDPLEYRNAIDVVKNIINQSAVKLDVLDVGGGFPSIYPGMAPQGLQSYFHEIFDSIAKANFAPSCQIWCEPGRALVAEAGSLVVRVEGRKNNMLYLNDGTYGGLFDAGHPGFIYPAKAMRFGENLVNLNSELAPFGFYGPTCDSLDTMHGPFYLPSNIATGDYIEIGQLGAYSCSIRTNFNGFNNYLQIQVGCNPLSSLYFSEKQVQLNQQNNSN
jgi:ornithine decarboxylase